MDGVWVVTLSTGPLMRLPLKTSGLYYLFLKNLFSKVTITSGRVGSLEGGVSVVVSGLPGAVIPSLSATLPSLRPSLSPLVPPSPFSTLSLLPLYVPDRVGATP